MKPFYDIAVVGSGFGGSLLALIACRLGYSVLLVERGQHPRFAIGESTSPLANLLLEEISTRYDLPWLLPLASYGPWQRTYPQLGVGLKRGFTFFHHERQADHMVFDRSHQLLVAASPDTERADTHWLRADVDQFLMQEAAAAGADYIDRASLNAPAWDFGPAEAATLTGTRRGRTFETRVRLIVDATGPRGFLSRALGLPAARFADYPATQSLYSHFVGVRRCDSLGFVGTDTPPYPADDAAVHHVFDGGWMWVLRLGDRLTSAGIAVTGSLAQELNLSEGPAAWRRFLRLFPSVAAQFSGARAVRPFVHAPQIAWRTSQAAGPGWALLPSAAAFVDPLFSTGIPLTLLGIERLGRLLEGGLTQPGCADGLADYEMKTLSEADAVADFIGACYAAMPRFSIFAALSMFYFAAASYSEMARRLGRPHLAGGFLAADHPEFGPGLRRASVWARHLASCPGSGPREFEKFAADAIAPLNIAGLCDPKKRNWYGIDLNDVADGAARLGMTPFEMRDVLKTAPWATPGR